MKEFEAIKRIICRQLSVCFEKRAVLARRWGNHEKETVDFSIDQCNASGNFACRLWQ